jgi:hypothetical protein
MCFPTMVDPAPTLIFSLEFGSMFSLVAVCRRVCAVRWRDGRSIDSRAFFDYQSVDFCTPSC